MYLFFYFNTSYHCLSFDILLLIYFCFISIYLVQYYIIDCVSPIGKSGIVFSSVRQ